MKKEKVSKTNAMRLLDAEHISYECHEYDVDESDLSGKHVAEQLEQSEDQLFKTLVTRTSDKQIAVFLVPVSSELNFKKAAGACGSKSVEMVHVREILELTGYIRGGCSPLGMKKRYPTYIDETAELFDTIFFSAGRRGLQIEMSPQDLASLINAVFIDLTN